MDCRLQVNIKLIIPFSIVNMSSYMVDLLYVLVLSRLNNLLHVLVFLQNNVLFGWKNNNKKYINHTKLLWFKFRCVNVWINVSSTKIYRHFKILLRIIFSVLKGVVIVKNFDLFWISHSYLNDSSFLNDFRVTVDFIKDTAADIFM